MTNILCLSTVRIWCVFYAMCGSKLKLLVKYNKQSEYIFGLWKTVTGIFHYFLFYEKSENKKNL